MSPVIPLWFVVLGLIIAVVGVLSIGLVVFLVVRYFRK